MRRGRGQTPIRRRRSGDDPLLFGALGNPSELVKRLLGEWRHGPVEVLQHPIYGRPVIAGQIRRGAPKAHADDLNVDSVGFPRSVGQFGVNLPMANPERGDLTV